MSWNKQWQAYNPPEFTMDHVLEGPEWADPDISGRYPKAKPPKTRDLMFNEIDGKVSRKSHTGKYSVVNGLPR